MNIRDIMTAQEITDSLGAGTDGKVIWDRAVAEMQDTQGNYYGDWEMIWPGGWFTFAATLNIDRLTIANWTPLIRGSRGIKWTYFAFPRDVAGLIVEAEGTVLERLVIYNDVIQYEEDQVWWSVAGSTDPTAHGINDRVGMIMNEVSVLYFGGDGLYMNCDARPVIDGGNTFNGNMWRYTNCSFSRNRGAGMHIINKDSNAGVAQSIDCTYNGGPGFWEDSFLGNTYLACHAYGNGWWTGKCYHDGNLYLAGVWISDDTTIEPDPSMTSFDDPWYLLSAGSAGRYWAQWVESFPYRCGPNYYSDSGRFDTPPHREGDVVSWCTWVGCYSEQGGFPNFLPHKHNVLGGDMGGGWVPSECSYETGDVINNGRDMPTYRDYNATEVDQLRLAMKKNDPAIHTPAQFSLLEMIHAKDGVWDHLAWQFRDDDSKFPSNFLLRTDHNASLCALGVTGENGFSGGAWNRTKEQISLASLFFPRGFFLGTPSGGGRYQWTDTVKPTWEGVWGDYCRNSAPVRGGPSGWCCLEDGTWVESGIVGMHTS